MRQFVHAKRRARYPTPRPTEQPVNHLTIYPDERGWKRLQQRVRE